MTFLDSIYSTPVFGTGTFGVGIFLLGVTGFGVLVFKLSNYLNPLYLYFMYNKYMQIPYFESLENALKTIFGEANIVSNQVISGGAINQARKLTLSNGQIVFLKFNQLDTLPFFKTEVTSLDALRNTHTIGIPQVYAYGIDSKQNMAFILLEYISSSKDYDWKTFGHELAQMHLASTNHAVQNGTYGFLEDNFIGSMPQKNTPHDSWIEFYMEERLKPQFEWAASYFNSQEQERIQVYFEKAKTYLIEPTFHSLLHGDLWIGNTTVGNNGKVWLIDPGSYVGHYEAELAMTELYGGYPNLFYQSYREIIPYEEGYEIRRDIYNLYHTVNHLNIFGERFYQDTLNLIEKLLLL